MILPGRVPGYQPRWLDECIAGGEWVWVCQGEGEGANLLAFLRRESLIHLPPPGTPSVEGPAGQVLESLRRRGASFVIDIAQDTGLSLSAVRSALWTLLRVRLVTNDRFDVIRRGEQALTAVSLDTGRRPGLIRRPATDRPEGRWSLVPWGRPEPEDQAIFQASLLLQRYGVVARELAQMDPWLPPWRILYEVLSRLELAGDVRRGYYVEGLTGAQFALPNAGRQLQDLAMPSTVAAPVVLLSSLDPANLYGSGAPLDIALFDGGTRPLQRRPGNWVALRGGRPVLLVEQQGKKLTALASASREDVAAAVGCLPSILDGDRSQGVRHKLTVEEWNGQPVTTTEGKDLLEAVGFVRDYQVMTLYAAWR
jgi:ATP-dependent Lhr-like helicase